MAIAEQTSIASHIASQFPEFIRNEGPRFVKFVEAYYDQAAQVDEAIYAARRLTENQDIDDATAVLIEYFRREFMANVPTSMLADKRHVTKHIREFYRARGSSDAYRFLFRILFGTEISFFYPGESILRTSDGRWVVETVLAVGAPLTGNPTLWEGHIITGNASGAVGRVESITKSTYAGVQTWELILSNVSGNFSGEELITNTVTLDTATVNTSSGPLSRMEVLTAGAFHRSDDTLLFSEPINTGTGATGVVTATSDESALTFKIIRSGKGYRTTSRCLLGGSTGRGASFSITALANTETINLNSDLINSVKNVVLNTGPLFPSLGSNTTTLSANLSSANIYSTIISGLRFSPTTVGRIAQITLTNPGTGYNRHIANGIPIVTVIDDQVSELNLPDGYGGVKGRDAIVVANNAPGAITTLRISTPGSAYNKNELCSALNSALGTGTVDETSTDAQQTGLSVTLRRQASYTASGTSIPGGTTLTRGRYIDTKGFLSWNNRLQDNDYYQEYSYVIIAPTLFNLFQTPVKTLLHPAGTKLFGTYLMDSTLDLSDLTVDMSVSVDVDTTVDYPTIIGFLDVDGGLVEIPEEEIVNTADESIYLEAESNTVVWTTMAGTVSIIDTTIISPFAANLISTFASIPISVFVNNRALFGTGTTFTAITPPHNIVIVSTSSPAANGLYTITSVISDTVAVFEPSYADSTLTSGYILY
jgi:hypothetical protein